MPAVTQNPEALFLWAATTTGCFLQIRPSSMICHVVHSLLLLYTKPTQLTAISTAHCYRQGPFGTGLLTSESVFFVIPFWDLPQPNSCHRNLCLAPLQFPLCSSWVNLITFGNPYKFSVSSSFAKNWVCFWMVLKRRKGKCWVIQPRT